MEKRDFITDSELNLVSTFCKNVSPSCAQCPFFSERRSQCGLDLNSPSMMEYPIHQMKIIMSLDRRRQRTYFDFVNQSTLKFDQSEVSNFKIIIMARFRRRGFRKRRGFKSSRRYKISRGGIRL